MHWVPERIRSKASKLGQLVNRETYLFILSGWQRFSRAGMLSWEVGAGFSRSENMRKMRAREKPQSGTQCIKELMSKQI